MDFDILGPLRVVSGEDELELGAPAQRGLLAILLTCPNAPVSADRLVDELWEDDPPPSAHHLLQVYVSRLRALLGELPDGPRIVHAGPGYAIRVGPGELDAERFATEVERARALVDRDPAAADEALAGALRLWRGDPFADVVPQSPAVRDHAVSLERRRQEAFETWIDVRLRLGRHHELIPELADFVARQPYDEAAHARLMLALYRSGRQAEALATARTLRSRLREELGIDLSSEVGDLYRDILLHAARLDLEPAPPPGNLPVRLTSFVGRERELGEVATLLDRSRLVTLTGPGGIGKTRLAIEVARGLRSRFTDGTWWIDLAPASDAETALEEAARVLGVSPSPRTDLAETVTAALGRRNVLLLLDNCEHVAAAIAGPLAMILEKATGPRVVATSRTPLRIAGEQLWRVPPLGLPAPDTDAGRGGASIAGVEEADAVRLFVERGKALVPSFVITRGNAAAVAELCSRLDGLSLAIEMAAARLPVMTPEEIVARLDDRLSLLELPSAGGITRHRTLLAALDTSYVLLSPPEQEALERLSVFAGTFDLEAAAAVGVHGGHPPSRALGVVSGLTDASLLSAEREDHRMRYRQLETVREYALARLAARGAEDDARRAHATYYLDLAEAAGAELGRPGFAPWMDRLAQDYMEICHALAWSLVHEPRAATLRAAPALREFWFRRGDAREALRWATRMLDGDLGAVPADLEANACNAAAFGLQLIGDVAASLRRTERAMALARAGSRPETFVFTLFGAEQEAFANGDFEAVNRHATDALRVCDESGERWARAGSLATLGIVNLLRDRSAAEGRALFEQAVPLYRELGDVGSLVLLVLGPLSLVAVAQGDLEAAERYAAEAVELATANAWQASALACYAQVLVVTRDLDGAAAAAAQAARLALDAGLETWFRIGLRVSAAAALARGRAEEAAVLIGGSRSNLPAYGLAAGMYEPLEARCRSGAGDGRFDALAARGEAMTRDELLLLVGAT